MVVKRVHMLLSGKVQGILFRDFAKQNASKLGIVGYAKNMRDGRFEVVAQGEERKLEDFIKLCRRGPMFARVESIDVKYEEVDDEGEFEYFDIRFS